MSRRFRIYVASSWRNSRQRVIVDSLRARGYEVYDFKRPHQTSNASHGEMGAGFSWEEIDPEFARWENRDYVAALNHIRAREGFYSDMEAMRWADAVVMVLPCGKSAHLEAGWACGMGKPTAVLLSEKDRPELMYLMASIFLEEAGVYTWLEDLREARIEMIRDAHAAKDAAS